MGKTTPPVETTALPVSGESGQGWGEVTRAWGFRLLPLAFPLTPPALTRQGGKRTGCDNGRDLLLSAFCQEEGDDFSAAEKGSGGETRGREDGSPMGPGRRGHLAQMHSLHPLPGQRGGCAQARFTGETGWASGKVWDVIVGPSASGCCC